MVCGAACLVFWHEKESFDGRGVSVLKPPHKKTLIGDILKKQRGTVSAMGAEPKMTWMRLIFLKDDGLNMTRDGMTCMMTSSMQSPSFTQVQYTSNVDFYSHHCCLG